MDNWAEKEDVFLELVINDWGMLNYLKDKKRIHLTPGVLLLKTKKDTRMMYKKGIHDVMEQKEKQKPGWMSEEFCGYLKGMYGIERVCMEWTRFGYGKIPMHVSIYAPWYQMNTSTGCILKAKCETGDRGKQVRTKTCRYYCRDHSFLYPKHLHMAGRYNTLFGLESDMKFQDLPEEADRIVWNFL